MPGLQKFDPDNPAHQALRHPDDIRRFGRDPTAEPTHVFNDRRPKPEPKKKPFRHTHIYQPLGLDSWDPRPHPGSQAIAPGTPVKKVAQLGKGKLAFHHIEDEHGNRMSVWKQSLQPRQQKPRKAPSNGPS